MNVKICGITTIEAARAAVENGANALGFVFAKSKRNITPEKAKEIIATLPKDIWKVGVFVNESKERIAEIISISGINAIQLHGDESNEFADSFSIPVIRAYSIQSREDVLKAKQLSSDYILLDSPKGKYHGGNGISFDWKLLKGIEWQDKKLILAGGLTVENVEQAIKNVCPYMVDVSSGVETNGVKDINKIATFLKNAQKQK